MPSHWPLLSLLIWLPIVGAALTLMLGNGRPNAARWEEEGLNRGVLQELEDQAARQGYRRVFLTTGFRQPEAVGLYLSHGYTALFDTSLPHETYRHLPFEKWLRVAALARAA